MSYSFSITADTKEEAGSLVEQELAKVVVAQSVHDADRQAAQDAAEAFIDLLTEPSEDEEVSVSLTGSLSWRDENVFVGASVNVSAYIRPR